MSQNISSKYGRDPPAKKKQQAKITVKLQSPLASNTGWWDTLGGLGEECPVERPNGSDGAVVDMRHKPAEETKVFPWGKRAALSSGSTKPQERFVSGSKKSPQNSLSLLPVFRRLFFGVRIRPTKT